MPSTASTKFTQDDEGRWFLPKDPDAELDYTVSIEKWLTKIGDTLASFEIVLPGGSELTVVDASQFTADGAMTAVISGGTTPNSMQAVTYRFTTAAGRIDDRTIYLLITDR